MITSTTETLNNAIRLNGNKCSNCIVLTKADGTTESLYDLRECKVERGLVQGNDYTIGGTFMASLDCIVSNTTLTISDFLNREVAVVARFMNDSGVYESIRIGVFTITRAEKKLSDIHITGYDNIMKFKNKKFTNFPTTDQTVTVMMQNLCREQGLTYTGANFSYDPTIPVSRFNNLGYDFTKIDMMSWLATVCSANIVADVYGRITMRRLVSVDYPYITSDDYIEFSYDTGVQKITGLEVNRPIREGKGKVYTFGDNTGKTMVIENNPLLALDLSTEIYNYLRTLSFRSFEVSVPLGDPRLEVGDIVYIRDIDNTLYTCPILNQSFNLASGCSATYSATIETYEDGMTEYEGEQTIKIKQLVDKIDNLEEELTEHIENDFSKCLKVDETASVDGIRSKSPWIHNIAERTQQSVWVINRNSTGRWRVILNEDNTLSFAVYDGTTYRYTPLKLNRDGSIIVGGDMESTNCKFSKAIIGDNETCEMSMYNSRTWQLKVDGGTYNNALQFEQFSGNANAVLRPVSTDKIQLGQASYKWSAVYATNTAIQSDRKVKREITDIENSKDFIMNLKPKQYKFINSDTKKGRLHYGFIAQEVADVASNVMNKDLALVKASYVTYDDDGNAIDNYYDHNASDKNLLWFLDYNEIIAPLLNVVQSQEKAIEELKEEIEKLKEGDKVS